MPKRTREWLAGIVLVGGALSGNALADGGVFGIPNPLGFYIGGGVGRSTIDQIQYDQIGLTLRQFDGNPLGWNAVMGVRPIPFLGAEVEYIDFGSVHMGAGPKRTISGTTLTTQSLRGEVRDRGEAVFAVGYLPLPLPFIEPFAKLGWGQVRERDSYSGDYGNIFTANGPLGLASGSSSDSRGGIAYGAGVQFRIEQFAVRVQYERITLSKLYGEVTSPSLLSVGLNWTF